MTVQHAPAVPPSRRVPREFRPASSVIMAFAVQALVGLYIGQFLVLLVVRAATGGAELDLPWLLWGVAAAVDVTSSTIGAML
jgi:hypothetical protein